MNKMSMIAAMKKKRMGKEDEVSSKDDDELAPSSAKGESVDPKKALIEPANLNREHNMAGDGSNPQKDTMGVDVHEPVEMQASPNTKANAEHGIALTHSALSKVKEKIGKMPMSIASHEEDVEDAAATNQDEQPAFPAPVSKVNKSGDPTVEWDKDKMNGDMGSDSELHTDDPDLTNEKQAISKLRGFKRVHALIGKMKNKGS